MKIKCDFCKTEYSVDRIPSTPVRCAICGHCWVAQTPSRRNNFFVFVAALCALLSAIIFTVVVITHYNTTHRNLNPLIATITASEIVTDNSGVSHFKVHGTVRNQSAEIYGVPDLQIVSYDADGNVLYRQRFAPSGTLIEGGALINFTHTLSDPSAGVKKISAELIGIEK